MIGANIVLTIINFALLTSINTVLPRRGTAASRAIGRVTF